MKKTKGIKIVLTASETEISDFRNSPFIAFTGSFPHRMPLWSSRRLLFPPPPVKDGRSKFAPYGLRKIEASLFENGFTQEDIITVIPDDLNKVIGPETKVLGISAMDPLGLAYVSFTYSTFLGWGNEPENLHAFQKIFRTKAVKKYKPKVIVGGAGSWQIGPKAQKMLGIDTVIVGEGDELAVEIFKKAVNGEPLPGRVKQKRSSPIDKIPIIKNAAVHGTVEISRGCGRNCQFCTPTMRKRRDMPIDRVVEEVKVNIANGNDMITLATEDLFLYKYDKTTKFHPNALAVYDLVKSIVSVPGVKSVQPAHISLAPAVVDPEMINGLTSIMNDYCRYHYKGDPIITAETGIETGSTRLIAKYMRGKCLPYQPEEWPEVVLNAYGVLNDNNWTPLATVIIGMPDEQESDVIQTLELVDEIFNYRSFLVPNLFANLQECILRKERRANFDACSDTQVELFQRCWEYNLHLWREDWLGKSRSPTGLAINLLTTLIMNGALLIYYQWGRGNLAKIRRDLIKKVAGRKPIERISASLKAIKSGLR
ncbi:MAG: B12-binding domain-containing radical SAM protein [Candidatus Helarchaeota archaeon]|nr:B12-binding domain-containing radical SAM protein [Candidatus Helarchaeota archaeon]